MFFSCFRRYYHPSPGEVIKEDASTKNGDVCEVWALTGFCKFGDKCWKRHPDLPESDHPSRISKPLTKNFEAWKIAKAAQGYRDEWDHVMKMKPTDDELTLTFMLWLHDSMSMCCGRDCAHLSTLADTCTICDQLLIFAGTS